MVQRTVKILDTVNFWINDFRAKMLKEEDQPIGYETLLSMLARLGTIVLSQPDKLTDEQKSMIIDFIEESNTYKPPYARIQWKDKYYQHMIPKILQRKDIPVWNEQTFKHLAHKDNTLPSD